MDQVVIPTFKPYLHHTTSNTLAAISTGEIPA